MRPSHEEWALRLAEVVAQRATCLRRSVGCVLTNGRNQVLATGYNGRAAGLEHCNQVTGAITSHPGCPDEYGHACAGARAASGTQLDACEAIHAEQNALLQCRDVYEIRNCYVTVSPCVTCVKLLLNTGCKRIIFRERYTHDEQAALLWEGQEYGDGRQWLLLPQQL